MHQQQASDSDDNQPQDTLNKGQFRQEILLQYYRYLNLLKRTNNFAKDINVYRQLNDHDFQDLAVVGWIFQVENIKIKVQEGKEQTCMVPIVYSNIKDPFKNYQDASNSKPFLNQLISNNAAKPSDPSSRPQPTLEPHLKRPLLLMKSLYTKYFIKAFNQIIKESKQFKKFFLTPTGPPNPTNPAPNTNIFAQIEWIYAFTGLRLAIEGDRLYFVITEKTKIIALDTKFYIEAIENLQKSVGFAYSFLTLNSMPKQYDFESIEQGYPLSNLQTQASIIDKISFTGILKQKFYDQVKASQKKDKEVVLTFLEDGIHPAKDTLGVAKVLIKCSFEESPEDIVKTFRIGYVYLVTNASVFISDNISILYKPKLKWKEHIFEINLQKSPEINSKMIKELPVVEMSWMKLANVNRNIVKVRVGLIRVEAFFGKLLCTHCKRPISSEGFCSGFCGENEGELMLWIIALVSDQSTYAEISMEKNEAFQFFDFTAEHLREIKRLILAQNSRKMVRLFERFNQIQPNYSSDPLLGFQRHMTTSFKSKTLIGVPRYNLNESFSHQLSEEEKTEFQQSLQTSKEYMKKNKVHFNGYVKKIEKNFKKAVPFIKVIEVVDQ